jgi:hypothetical protein
MFKFVAGLVLGVALGVWGVSGVVKTTTNVGKTVVGAGSSLVSGVAK